MYPYFHILIINFIMKKLALAILLMMFFFISSSQACFNNTSNCSICLNEYECSECQANYILVNGKCFSCQIKDCLLCHEDNICSQCIRNLIPIDNGSKCGCLSSQTEFDNSCYTCQIEFCIQCSDDNTCFTCESQYEIYNNFCILKKSPQLYSSDRSNALFSANICNIQNCKNCSTSSICSQCNSYYTLINNQCIPCPILNCINCFINFCSACVAPFVPNVEGTSCIICNITGCNSCSSQNQCFSCQNGLEVNKNKTACVQCTVNGCLFCEINNICSECYPGFILNSSINNCIPCTYPCQTCGQTSDQCLTCFYPYSSINQYNYCFTCATPHCKTCSFRNQSICSQCLDSYLLTESYSCQRLCPDIFCLNCSSQSPDYCLQCRLGYVLVEGKCTRCQNFPNCTNCDSNNLLICTSCNIGYYLQGSICLPCQLSTCAICNALGCIKFKQQIKLTAFVTNGSMSAIICNRECLICSHIIYQKCLVCFQGFSLTSNFSCIMCGQGCKTCLAENTTQCFSCFSNFQYVNGTCIKNAQKLQLYCPGGYTNSLMAGCLPCLFNCFMCSSLSINLCFQCVQGYFLNQTDSLCYPCSTPFCSDCQNNFCQKCQPGYFLDLNFTCAQICMISCQDCSSNRSYFCPSCISGYQLSQGGMCSPIYDCNQTCQICPLYQYNSLGFCYFCSFNCQFCISFQICISCNEGYFLSNGICEPLSCSFLCKICSYNSICLQCLEGYFLVEGSDQCQPCKLPCVTCNMFLCTACAEGFVLEGWNCISNFNFGFSISLQANQYSFQQFYFDIKNNVKQYEEEGYISGISYTTLTSGSGFYNITGNVSIFREINSTQGSHLYQKLLTGRFFYIFQSGANIVSYQLFVNGASFQIISTSKQNIILIVSVLCPLIFLLIMAIVFLKCSSNKRQESISIIEALNKTSDGQKQVQLNQKSLQ